MSDYANARQAINNWLHKHGTQIAARLNQKAPGANLEPLHTVHLMALCPLEKAAFGHSPFCRIFNKQEWEAFELFWDVQKWFAFGHGNPLGPVQGVGWTTELLSRLNGVMVLDDTQTNHSLSSFNLVERAHLSRSALNNDPTTFPFDRSIYVDLSHDNEMVVSTSLLCSNSSLTSTSQAIFSALGLFKTAPTLPRSKNSFIVSEVVPFAGRLIVERYTCPSTEPHVRLLLNDRIIRDLCPGQACSDGLFPLQHFNATQHFSTTEGQALWPRCKHKLETDEEGASAAQVVFASEVNL
jgi:hypothetical protein